MSPSGGRDHAGRPAHHVIAGEQRAAFLQRIAQVVGGVARCGHRSQRPVRPAQAVAVAQYLVGNIVAVERGIGARAVPFQRQRGAADDRGAGRRFQRGGGGGMIAVSVGAADRGHARLADRGQQRFKVGGVGRAGIDHRHHVRPADDVAFGPGIREIRRIGRQHAPHQRLDLLGKACRPWLFGNDHARDMDIRTPSVHCPPAYP